MTYLNLLFAAFLAGWTATASPSREAISPQHSSGESA
jgi:hypothetical protein